MTDNVVELWACPTCGRKLPDDECEECASLFAANDANKPERVTFSEPAPPGHIRFLAWRHN